MTCIHCHRCGRPLAEGSVKYQVDIRVRALLDGAPAELEQPSSEGDVGPLVDDLSAAPEEELVRRGFEDDVFVLCASCKEAFLKDVYTDLHSPEAPGAGRAHLVN